MILNLQKMTIIGVFLVTLPVTSLTSFSQEWNLSDFRGSYKIAKYDERKNSYYSLANDVFRLTFFWDNDGYSIVSSPVWKYTNPSNKNSPSMKVHYTIEQYENSFGNLPGAELPKILSVRRVEGDRLNPGNDVGLTTAAVQWDVIGERRVDGYKHFVIYLDGTYYFKVD